MTVLSDKFTNIESQLNGRLFERKDEIHGALLALLAEKHFFMIGPPGTAKSLLVRMLMDSVDFSDSDLDHPYFQWLLTRYTTPEEIYGPPSIAELEKGNYVRVTNRKLPEAAAVFLDEIFNAGSSVLNILLTAIHERRFFNGADDSRIPLSSLFAASNLLPEEDNLWALWDRLHLRYEVKPLQESGNFIKLLENNSLEPLEKLITWGEVKEAQREVSKVSMTTEVIETLRQLRDDLKRAGFEPSERRFAESLQIIKASAWLKGRDTVALEDIRILQHVMWNRTEDIGKVERIVLELANPLDRETFNLRDKLVGLVKEYDKIVKSKDVKARGKGSYEIWSKTKRLNSEIEAVGAKMEEKSELYNKLHSDIRLLAKNIAENGLDENG